MDDSEIEITPAIDVEFEENEEILVVPETKEGFSTDEIVDDVLLQEISVHTESQEELSPIAVQIETQPHTTTVTYPTESLDVNPSSFEISEPEALWDFLVNKIQKTRAQVLQIRQGENSLPSVDPSTCPSSLSLNIETTPTIRLNTYDSSINCHTCFEAQSDILETHQVGALSYLNSGIRADFGVQRGRHTFEFRVLSSIPCPETPSRFKTLLTSKTHSPASSPNKLLCTCSEDYSNGGSGPPRDCKCVYNWNSHIMSRPTLSVGFSSLLDSHLLTPVADLNVSGVADMQPHPPGNFASQDYASFFDCVDGSFYTGGTASPAQPPSRGPSIPPAEKTTKFSGATDLYSLVIHLPSPTDPESILLPADQIQTTDTPEVQNLLKELQNVLIPKYQETEATVNFTMSLFVNGKRMYGPCKLHPRIQELLLSRREEGMHETMVYPPLKNLSTEDLGNLPLPNFQNSSIAATLFPTFSVRHTIIIVNFGSSPHTRTLPFQSTLLRESPHMLIPSPLTRPADGVFDVLLPVGLPNEGVYYWADYIQSAFCSKFTELSDRSLFQWFLQSGYRRLAPSNRSLGENTSTDRMSFAFEVSPLHDWAKLRRSVRLLSQSKKRHYIIMEVKRNLLSADRTDTILDFSPPNFQCTIHVLLGRPHKGFAQWCIQKGFINKSKFNVDNSQDSKVPTISFEQDQQTAELLSETRKQMIQSTMPLYSLEQISETPLVVTYPQLLRDISSWNVPAVGSPFIRPKVPDLVQKIFVQSFEQFSLPCEGDTVKEENIIYPWTIDSFDEGIEFLHQWKCERRISEKLPDHKASSAFDDKLADWTSFVTKCMIRQIEYKKVVGEPVSSPDSRRSSCQSQSAPPESTPTPDLLKMVRDLSTAFRPKETRTPGNSSSTGDSSDPKTPPVMLSSDEIDPKQRFSPSFDENQEVGETFQTILQSWFSELSNPLKSEFLWPSSSQIKDGVVPFYANFTESDWAILCLNVELHLMANFLIMDLKAEQAKNSKMDVSEIKPDLSFHWQLLKFYYHRTYYKKSLEPSEFLCDDIPTLIERFCPSTIHMRTDCGSLSPKLTLEMPWEFFLRCTELSRRMAIDASKRNPQLQVPSFKSSLAAHYSNRAHRELKETERQLKKAMEQAARMSESVTVHEPDTKRGNWPRNESHDRRSHGHQRSKRSNFQTRPPASNTQSSHQALESKGGYAKTQSVTRSEAQSRNSGRSPVPRRGHTPVEVQVQQQPYSHKVQRPVASREESNPYRSSSYTNKSRVQETHRVRSPNNFPQDPYTKRAKVQSESQPVYDTQPTSSSLFPSGNVTSFDGGSTQNPYSKVSSPQSQWQMHSQPPPQQEHQNYRIANPYSNSPQNPYAERREQIPPTGSGFVSSGSVVDPFALVGQSTSPVSSQPIRNHMPQISERGPVSLRHVQTQPGLFQNQHPHQQVPHQQVPHQQVPHQQVPHQQVPHQQVPHQQVPHQQNSQSQDMRHQYHYQSRENVDLTFGTQPSQQWGPRR